MSHETDIDKTDADSTIQGLLMLAQVGGNRCCSVCSSSTCPLTLSHRCYLQCWIHSIPHWCVGLSPVKPEINTYMTPAVGSYFKIWWLDALGGLLLSLVVIYNWSSTSSEHIKNLSGFSATADERNIRELYLSYHLTCSC
jgi:hypothetical protein